MDTDEGIFKFNFSAIHHGTLIPTLHPDLRQTLNRLITGIMTPDKYHYYLYYGMMHNFDIVHHKVGQLENSIASLNNNVQMLQEQINNLKKKIG